MFACDHYRMKLGKIRCLVDCIESLENAKPLPKALCYVAHQLPYQVKHYKGENIIVYSQPTKSSSVLIKLKVEELEEPLYLKGDEWCTSEGTWRFITSVSYHYNSYLPALLADINFAETINRYTY